MVHCWEGYPNYCWYPQTKKELEGKGFKVEVPQMPEANLPHLSKWLGKLREVIGEPDKELCLVGHSLGCITIMRYLENINRKVGGVVLVAGFTDDLGYKELENFFQTPISFAKIKNNAGDFVAINSDNDPYVSLNYGKEFQEKLGAKLIIQHNMGHFSGPIDNEESCISLPEVAASLINTKKAG